MRTLVAILTIGLLLGGSLAWAEISGIGAVAPPVGTPGWGAQGPGISGMPCPGISICPGMGMMGAMFGGGLFRGGAAGPVGPGAAAPIGGLSRGGAG